MSSDTVGTLAKAVGALTTIVMLVWAHGSWVSSVNVTLAETGRAMATVGEGVKENSAKIAKMEASIVRVSADVSSVKENNTRIEALANGLSKHVGDLREVVAELKGLAKKINGREK